SYSSDGGYTWSTSPIKDNLTSGYYYVMIKSGTCISSSTSVSIKQFYLPNPTYTLVQPTCGTGGTITFTTPSAQYSIDGGQTWSSNPVFTNLTDGYYSLVIQNAQGCKSVSYGVSVSLQKYYLPKPNVSIVQPT